MLPSFLFSTKSVPTKVIDLRLVSVKSLLVPFFPNTKSDWACIPVSADAQRRSAHNLIFLKFILIYFVNELLSSLDFRMNTDAKTAR